MPVRTPSKIPVIRQTADDEEQPHAEIAQRQLQLNCVHRWWISMLTTASALNASASRR
jgi:hypothetical protein